MLSHTLVRMAETDSDVKPEPLLRPVSQLQRVGAERSVQLARLGIHTVGDLVLHQPRRHEDRRHVRPIGSLAVNETVSVRGQILALGLKRFAKGRKSVFELILDDGTSRLHCRWWNLPYMQNYFAKGDEVIAYGKVNSIRPRTIDHPETEVIDGTDEGLIHLNRIVPIYPLTEGISQRWLRSLMFSVVQENRLNFREPWKISLEPEFPSRGHALEHLHFPEAIEQIERSRQRLALDELIGLQLSIQARRKRLLEKAPRKSCPGDNSLIKVFLAGLGFQCTNSQNKVLREIRSDLRSGTPMRRLLQGDVGSGKTVVSACSALMVIESGYNAVLMAPTEILAEQHFQSFERWFRPLGVGVRIRTSNRKKTYETSQPTLEISPNTKRAETLTIGTHALIEESFSMDNLGLVIIDEQHRFGVAQREKLVRKGEYPHLLVMTATPIPRSLGLTLYGDLDVSVIDELPSGRISVKTFIRTAASLPKVWAFVREKLVEGRQAYVVYPRIESDGAIGLKSVTEEFDKLREELKPHKVGLLHGNLPRDEKEAVMNAFRENAVQVLLTTSVIEVGVDVPNATVMLIENAEQFGLAQLHQLRGRIGRGTYESHCILITERTTAESSRRLKILAETADGFQIAEADLKIRGPGDLLGQEQSGWPTLVFANLGEDLRLVERARDLAASILKTGGD